MAKVPEAYFEFVMHYAPWLYVVSADLTADPPAGQKNVTVSDGTKFVAGMPCQIKDSVHSEWNEVDAVNGNVVTLKNYLQFTYHVLNGGSVEHGDLAFGKGAMAAAFAVEFLHEAYNSTQFAAKQTEILQKIIELSDWLLTQQCTTTGLKAYGGFKSAENSLEYWSVDAGRCIPALLKAYKLTKNADYLNAAKLAGYTFLYNMQLQDELQLLVENPGSLLEGFEVLGDWTIGGTGASQQVDSSYFMQGLQSLKVNATGGNGAYSTKTVNYSLASASNFVVWVYVHDLANLYNVTFYLSSTSNWSKYFIAMVSSLCLKSGWNRIILTKSQFTSSGGESWDNTMIRFRVRVNPNASVNASVSFDDFRHSMQARARCIITFDDGWESVYLKAKPIMDANSQRGVEFVITNLVGTSGRLNLSELNTLYSAGWDISNHTKDHINLTTLTESEVEAQVDDAYNWLRNNGFSRSAPIFTYPYGAYNDQVLAKVKVNHKLARSVILDAYQPNLEVLGYNIEHLLKITNVTNITSVASVQSRIDTAIEQKGLLILLFHQIVDSGASAETQYLTSDFQAISNYLKTKAADIDVVTLSDIISWKSNIAGFKKYVTIDNLVNNDRQVEDIYDFIGLKMLADTYNTANSDRYYAMMIQAISFLREGLEKLYLYYDVSSLSWKRTGINQNEIYDDPISFALHGLYNYEGWSGTCQRVYNFLQSIKASGQYPAYWPEICWPGYINVITGFPACAYYDDVTTGILWKIRKERDPPSLKLAHQAAEKYQNEFLFWGPLFEDYSPITPQKAMANVTWLARMFLNFEEPKTQFTRLLKSKGEAVLLYPVRQAVDKVEYGEALDLLAVVSPVKAEQVLIEPGYYLNDYLAFYTFLPVRPHDKLVRQGQDYEVQTVTPYTFANQRFYFKSIARRLLNN